MVGFLSHGVHGSEEGSNCDVRVYCGTCSLVRFGVPAHATVNDLKQNFHFRCVVRAGNYRGTSPQ